LAKGEKCRRARYSNKGYRLDGRKRNTATKDHRTEEGTWVTQREFKYKEEQGPSSEDQIQTNRRQTTANKRQEITESRE
jgi:hypothetical protein